MLWSDCLKLLENDLPDQELNTWLRTLHGQEHDETLLLLAPNDYVLRHVTSYYLDRIVTMVRRIKSNDSFQVRLQIGSADYVAPIPVSSDTGAMMPVGEIDTTPFPNSLQQPAELQNRSSNGTSGPPSINSIAQGQVFQTPEVPAIPLPDVGLSNAENQVIFANNLNPALTFDNFVEGKSNQLARASAIQVGENPGTSYNPLFIFGGVGLGKTHLMHAVGNHIKAHNPSANVVYLHSERFVNGMVAALRHNRIEEFKNYYRSVDALLIDDIQFFANKTRSMEEFFHTFNVLLECQKQIIMTGDRLPREVENLDDRLQSRLVWGLTVEVEPPDVETRVAILRKKVEHMGLDIPNEVAFFIARRFRSNIRDLEGALLRVLAILRLRNTKTITLDFVQEALRDQLAVMDKMVTIESIKKLVAEHFNIRVADLDSKSRARSITRPRQMAMALSKELTNHSLPEIGEKFGGRDHTTVLHACRKVRELIQSDSRMEEAHRILSRTLRS
ncbi:chromosomal replication initiator protein DnaA [Leucothrix sargassi]|nr:chromosomal replication initiator protein DnaA [Leucothrix sargassi]